VFREGGMWDWWSAVGLAWGPFEPALGFGTRCTTGSVCADQVLAERSRVRDELEHTPEHAVSAELAARYQRLDDEFIRRARIARTRQVREGD
jgi:hypothetical protein